MLQINDQSYAGTFASQYWTPAFFGSETLKKGVVNVIDGIKDKANIGNMDFTGGFQPRQATPTTPNGAWIIDKKYLQPQDAMLYAIFNPRDLETHWESENLSTLLLDRKLPATFEAYVMYTMMSRVFEKMETGWWMSSKDYQNITDLTDPRYYMQFFDGFIKQLLADPLTLQYNAPATITTSNISTFMDGLLSLITINARALIGKAQRYERLKYVMSPNTELIYKEMLTTGTQFKGIDYSSGETPRWKGYKVETLAGFPDNTIILAEFVPSFDGAFHIGMNSKDDSNTIQMEKTRPMDETYFIKALTKMDVKHKFGNEIAICTTLTSNSFII